MSSWFSASFRNLASCKNLRASVIQTEQEDNIMAFRMHRRRVAIRDNAPPRMISSSARSLGTLAPSGHIPMPMPRVRVKSHEIPASRATPLIWRPRRSSMTGRHGTSVNS